MEELKILQKTEQSHEVRWWGWNLRGKSTATFVRGISTSGRVRRDSASFRINQGGKHYSLGYRRVSDAQGGVHAPN